MSKKRRLHSAQFKAQVGLEALKGIEPVQATVAAKHSVLKWTPLVGQEEREIKI